MAAKRNHIQFRVDDETLLALQSLAETALARGAKNATVSTVARAIVLMSVQDGARGPSEAAVIQTEIAAWHLQKRVVTLFSERFAQELPALLEEALREG